MRESTQKRALTLAKKLRTDPKASKPTQRKALRVLTGLKTMASEISSTKRVSAVSPKTFT